MELLTGLGRVRRACPWRRRLSSDLDEAPRVQPHRALELDTQGEHCPAYEPPLISEEESWKHANPGERITRSGSPVKS